MKTNRSMLVAGLSLLLGWAGMAMGQGAAQAPPQNVRKERPAPPAVAKVGKIEVKLVGNAAAPGGDYATNIVSCAIPFPPGVLSDAASLKVTDAKGRRGAPNSTIRLTEPGTGKLLWSEQVCIWGRQNLHSYYFARNTERHIGLGRRETVDVSVEFYPTGKKVEMKGVPANKTLLVQEEN